jgi:hypothetical protein
MISVDAITGEIYLQLNPKSKTEDAGWFHFRKVIVSRDYRKTKSQNSKKWSGKS